MKNNNSSRRFNIIDVIIAIGIILAIISCITILSGTFYKSKITTVRYCVKLEGVDIKAENVLTEGMRIYSSDLNIPVGIVKSSDFQKMTITSFDRETNRFVTKEQDGLYTLYLYLDAGCSFENGCYHTENLRISENTKIDINVPFLYNDAEIVSVTPVNNSEEEK